MFRKVEVKCWGVGAEGARNARTVVGMTRQGGVEAGESRKRVGAEGARSWESRYPSDGCDVGMRVMGCAGLKVDMGDS